MWSSRGGEGKIKKMWYIEAPFKVHTKWHTELWASVFTIDNGCEKELDFSLK